jgi:hypothetical protein
MPISESGSDDNASCERNTMYVLFEIVILPKRRYITEIGAILQEVKLASENTVKLFEKVIVAYGDYAMSASLELLGDILSKNGKRLSVDVTTDVSAVVSKNLRSRLPWTTSCLSLAVAPTRQTISNHYAKNVIRVRTQEQYGMQKIETLFGQYQKAPDKRRRTERSDLLETFLLRLNPGRKAKGYDPLTYGRLAYLLAGIGTKDLYALLSKCNDAERRGYPWSAIFWKELRPNKSET